MSDARRETLPREGLMVYFSMLRALRLTEGGVSNIRGFSCKSIEEHGMWGEGFAHATPSKQLLVYGMLEELRTLLERNPLPRMHRIAKKPTPHLWLLPLTSLGLYWSAVARDVLGYHLEKFEGGAALGDFLDHCAEWGERFRDELPHVEDRKTLGPSAIFSGAKLYVDSGYLAGWEGFQKRSVELAIHVGNSGILSSFASLYELSQHGILGVPKKEENLAPGGLNAKVIFKGAFPLWANPMGHNSIFAYLFRDLLPLSERAALLDAELLRLFYYANENDRAIVGRNAALYSARQMLFRRSDAPGDVSAEPTGVEGEILQAIVAGEGARGISELQNYALSRKLLEARSGEIGEIVRAELKNAYEQFRKLAERGYSDLEAAKILRLFLINVFSRTMQLITVERPVFLGKMKEEHVDEIGRLLGSLVYRPIEEVKSEEGWL